MKTDRVGKANALAPLKYNERRHPVGQSADKRSSNTPKYCQPEVANMSEKITNKFTFHGNAEIQRFERELITRFQELQTAVYDFNRASNKQPVLLVKK